MEICGPRASKSNPLILTREELEKRIRTQFSLSWKDIKNMTKQQLCSKLGLPFTEKEPQKKLMDTKNKICTRKKSIPRYTLDELQKLAIEKKVVSLTEIHKLKYFELCALLKLPSDTTLPIIKQPSPIIVKSGNCKERNAMELKKHQSLVVQYLEHHRGLIVFHKMGSGKTLTAVTTSQCYLDSYPMNRVIVIAPAGLINNFKDEMTNKYVHIKHKDKYEFYSFQKFLNLSKQKKNVNCRNSLIIIDEAHNLRTPFQDAKDPKKRKGITTKEILECTQRAHKILVLTGTPLYNSPNDIFSLYNMIKDPHHEDIKVNNIKDPSSLYSKLKCKISFHDTQDDPNFPSRKDVYEYITMTPIYQKKYEELVESIMNKIKSSFVSSLFGEKDLVPFFNAVRRAVNNLDNTDQNKKLDWVVQKIKNIPSHEKVLVFSNFLKAGIHLIMKRLPSTESVAFIDGSIPMSKRKEIVENFNKGNIRVLFISKAGGEGLDMKGVRHVILMEPTWNQSSIEQVIARAIRYKSHEHLPPNQRNVTIHHIMHIFPTDSPKIKQINTFLTQLKQNPNSVNHEIDLSPYDNSFDLYLDYFLRRKQIRLDFYNNLLKSLSIEKNKCL